LSVPATSDDFLDHLRVSALVQEDSLREYLDGLRSRNDLAQDPRFLAGRFVRDGLLTTFQAQQLLQGRHRNFIVGRYKLLEPIGAGGMGKVFLCEHLELGRRVAMKVLASRRDSDPAMLARFMREARVIAGLDHPNIVRALDFDCCDGKIHYIIMDYVDGVGLNELVRRRGRLDPDLAAHYIAQAACGLQYIHESGLIHRDVKPGNLIVDCGGVVKILDLGLARLQDDQEQITARFNDTSILGTADFIAPEQSLINGQIDHRADIYGLGTTFYYLLTGRTPFGGQTIAEKLIGHQLRQPTPPEQFAPGLPEELKSAVSRMMAKLPDDRFQSAGEVLVALSRWVKLKAPPQSSELPQLSSALQGSSRWGMKKGSVGAHYLAAARAALGATPRVGSPRKLRNPSRAWLWFGLGALAAGGAAAALLR
jgi:eukaryotic-like serine/threonine-protein kinase